MDGSLVCAEGSALPWPCWLWCLWCFWALAVLYFLFPVAVMWRDRCLVITLAWWLGQRSSYCPVLTSQESASRDCSLSWLAPNMAWLSLCFQCGHPCPFQVFMEYLYLIMTIIKCSASACSASLMLMESFLRWTILKYLSATRRVRTFSFPFLPLCNCVGLN